MPQKDKEAMLVRFLQEERSWKRGGKETKDAAHVVNSELGRKRQEKGIRELKGIKNVGGKERNIRKALCSVCH